MPHTITIPHAGERVTSVRLVNRHVLEGSAVKQGHSIAEVETAKANADLFCEVEGVVAYWFADVGDQLAIGDALCVIALKDEDVDAVRSEYARKHVSKPSSAKPSVSFLSKLFGLRS